MLRLYTTRMSSAARRVEIACRLKGLEFERVLIDLAEEKAAVAGYRQVNPQVKVPSLEDGAVRLTQSLAILEYLEEAYPAVALLPDDAVGRARVRALALVVACEMHPLQNSWVVRYLSQDFGIDATAGGDWQRHWIVAGLEAIEARLVGDAVTGDYCHGDQPTLADCCLAPQVWNALRYAVPMAPYPTTRRVYDACLARPEFAEVLG